VGTYLELAVALEGERWRLVNRALADGTVPASRDEVYELLREAIRARVEEGLPLSVPEEIADSLAPAVAAVRERLAEVDVPSPDAVEPELYPPCVKALRERAAAGEELPPRSRFALASFLATIGAETDEIVAEFDGDTEAVREQVVHLRADDGAEYPPPSCATMDAYGDCVDTDSLCERVAHPLEYYDRRLDGATPDQVSRPESQ
jgi:DNA primase large subunit